MAAGHYLPLADGPCVAHGPEPSGLLQSGSEDTDQSTANQSTGRCLLELRAHAQGTGSESAKGWRPSRTLQPWNQTELLEFGLGAGFDQLLGSGFGVGLGHAFFDHLGSAVHQVFGFLEAQTGDFTHGLDDGHLVGASVGQDNVELGLLFGSSGASGSTTSISAANRGSAKR